MFARGQAVAVLILLEAEGETYVVLTEQVLRFFGIFFMYFNCSGSSILYN